MTRDTVQESGTSRMIIGGLGIVQGIKTFVGVYLLTGVVLVFEVGMALENAAGSALDETARALGTGVAIAGVGALGRLIVTLLKLIGWVVFNAHHVPIVAMGSARAETASGSVNLLASATSFGNAPLTPLLYYAIPLLFLGVGGAQIVRGAASIEGIDFSSPVMALVPGVAVALGYIPAMVLAATLVTISFGGPGVSVSAGPNALTAAKIAAGYSVLAGGVGGIFGAVLVDQGYGIEVS